MFYLFSTVFFACNNESKPDAADTGLLNNGDTGEVVVEECEATILDQTPANGASGWFYRDPVTVVFSESNPTLDITVTDSTGAEVAVAYEWDDTRFNISILPESGSWNSSESYALLFDLCGSQPEISFSTSSYGDEMTINPDDLIGRTYLIALDEAEYIEPPGVGALLSTFIDMPLLFGVSNLVGDEIDFVAALGEQDNVTGVFEPVGAQWDFGGVDFSTRPYFSAQTEQLVIPYATAEIPVFDFSVSGTFSADGADIGEARFSGLGDTSGMGVLLNLGTEPSAVCTGLLASVGLDCIECPNSTSNMEAGGMGDSDCLDDEDNDGDGFVDHDDPDCELYCIRLTGVIDEAAQIPGLDISQSE